MSERIKSFFHACARIVFLRSSFCGALLVAIMLLRPSMAVSGFIAVLTAYGVAWLIGMEKEFHVAAPYIFNPLLVGLSLGCRFDFCIALLLLAAIAGVFTLVLTIVLARVTHYARLPILSLPFALTTSLLYLAVLGYWNVLEKAGPSQTLWNPDMGLPLWLAGLLKSLSVMIFFPNVFAGILIAALILFHSRVLFMLAVAGYYVGVLVHSLLLASLSQSFQDLNSFNYILIAMALGAVFLVPSVQSCLLAMIGVAVASPLMEAFAVLGAPYGIPPFTLPYCLVTIGAIYVLRMVDYPLLSTGLGRNPEEIRENLLVNRFRYCGNQRTLYLPFSGTWTVTQGFKGKLTHQGIWRYAYDFQITDEDGKTHRGDGKSLQDYYCYRKPVLAPIRGQVIRLIDYHPDNPIGSVDGYNNWGNLVILYDTRGFYVEISHFVPGSIRPKVGDWVERGSVLGLCGNSGYSPQPHLHIQVQANDVIGSATMPFSFVSYHQAGTYHANNLPVEGDRVEPMYPEKKLDEATGFLLGDVHEYDIFRQGHPTGRLSLRVGMAPDGCYYFESQRAKLYFGKHEGTFYIYRLEGNDPHLRLLFMALPRLPLAFKNCLNWHDYVPVGVAATGIKRGLARFASFLRPSVARVKVTQSFCGSNCVESILESKILGLKTAARVELDGRSGFSSVQIGNIELRKTINGHSSTKLLSSNNKSYIKQQIV